MNFTLIDALDNRKLMLFRLDSYIRDNIKATMLESYVDDFSVLEKLRLSITLGESRINCEVVRFNKDTKEIELKLDMDTRDKNRQYERIKINDRLLAHLPEHTIEVIGTNISFGGLRLRSARKLAVGNILDIELRTDKNNFYFEIQIVNATEIKDSNEIEYGAKFLVGNMSKEQHDALYNYLLKKDKQILFDMISTSAELQLEVTETNDRKFARINIDDTFAIREADKFNTIGVAGVNISLGGMRIRTKDRFDIGSSIIIELNSAVNTFYFDSKIVSATEIENSRELEYGVVFTETNMRREQKEALYDYVFRNNRANKLRIWEKRISAANE